MQKLILLLFFPIFIFSCGEKQNSNKKTEIKEIVEQKGQIKPKKSDTVIETKETKQLIENNKSSNCKCFNGIGSTKGDKPSLIFKFLNGSSVNVCGYYDKEIQEDKNLIMSEFNIFDCLTGKSYVEYDATQTCRIKETENSLIIEELRYLPSGENWSWELIQIAEQKVSSNTTEIIVSEITPKIKTIRIDPKTQADFLNSIKKGQGISDEWELEIGKLVVVALSGNESAWNILKDYENYTGETTDGAVAETWKEAVSLVKWIKGK
ncbi:hypothetical protein [Kordia sp.]|uniref:hypothetical protein n=1 Tax=Kordia sp. TaxID=1965332 RepID=UPI003B5C3260